MYSPNACEKNASCYSGWTRTKDFLLFSADVKPPDLPVVTGLFEYIEQWILRTIFPKVWFGFASPCVIQGLQTSLHIWAFQPRPRQALNSLFNHWLRGLPRKSERTKRLKVGGAEGIRAPLPLGPYTAPSSPFSSNPVTKWNSLDPSWTPRSVRRCLGDWGQV